MFSSSCMTPHWILCLPSRTVKTHCKNSLSSTSSSTASQPRKRPLPTTKRWNGDGMLYSTIYHSRLFRGSVCNSNHMYVKSIHTRMYLDPYIHTQDKWFHLDEIEIDFLPEPSWRWYVVIFTHILTIHSIAYMQFLIHMNRRHRHSKGRAGVSELP